MDDFLLEYEKHLEDIDWLSKAIVILSANLYTHNSEMAKAELRETQASVRFLTDDMREKKLSVSEAEKRAQMETSNEYGVMKAQGEAIIETINSIKKRIDVLSYERHNG